MVEKKKKKNRSKKEAKMKKKRRKKEKKVATIMNVHHRIEKIRKIPGILNDLRMENIR